MAEDRDSFRLNEPEEEWPVWALDLRDAGRIQKVGAGWRVDVSAAGNDSYVVIAQGRDHVFRKRAGGLCITSPSIAEVVMRGR